MIESSENRSYQIKKRFRKEVFYTEEINNAMFGAKYVNTINIIKITATGIIQ